MSEVILLSGLPGAGKSTHAAWMLSIYPDMVLISTDQIREELTGDMSNQSQNQQVYFTAWTRARAALAEGRDVIIDSTALTQADRQFWFDCAGLYYVVPHVTFIRTPFLVCLWRNWRRERTVPFKVMWKMWKKQRADAALRRNR